MEMIGSEWQSHKYTRKLYCLIVPLLSSYCTQWFLSFYRIKSFKHEILANIHHLIMNFFKFKSISRRYNRCRVVSAYSWIVLILTRCLQSNNLHQVVQTNPAELLTKMLKNKHPPNWLGPILEWLPISCGLIMRG